MLALLRLRAGGFFAEHFVALHVELEVEVAAEAEAAEGYERGECDHHRDDPSGLRCAEEKRELRRAEHDDGYRVVETHQERAFGLRVQVQCTEQARTGEVNQARFLPPEHRRKHDEQQRGGDERLLENVTERYAGEQHAPVERDDGHRNAVGCWMEWHAYRGIVFMEQRLNDERQMPYFLF
jgi:hypothetical protein